MTSAEMDVAGRTFVAWLQLNATAESAEFVFRLVEGRGTIETRERRAFEVPDAGP